MSKDLVFYQDLLSDIKNRIRVLQSNVSISPQAVAKLKETANGQPPVAHLKIVSILPQPVAKLVNETISPTPLAKIEDFPILQLAVAKLIDNDFFFMGYNYQLI